MPKTPKKPKPERPATIKTAEDRGLALRAWLYENRIKVGDFAINAKIGRSTLNRYLNGEMDLATISQDIAENILRASGISDEDFWELIDLPAEHQATFRSFRAWPMGHGSKALDASAGATIVRLSEPMFGSVALPAGTVLRVEFNRTDAEHQIYKLKDGRFFSVSGGTVVDPTTGAILIGGLVSADFATLE